LAVFLIVLAISEVRIPFLIAHKFTWIRKLFPFCYEVPYEKGYNLRQDYGMPVV